VRERGPLRLDRVDSTFRGISGYGKSHCAIWRSRSRPNAAETVFRKNKITERFQEDAVSRVSRMKILLYENQKVCFILRYPASIEEGRTRRHGR
jgi:hypothetical protein